MAEQKPAVTGTTHLLPFHALAPLEFERLCLWLVEDEGYHEARHLGLAGGEKGRDILAKKGGKLVAFQCKRVQKFDPSQAEIEVNKILGLPADERPAQVIFIVTCAVSAEVERRSRQALGKDIPCQFWAVSELDAKVKRSPEILEEFFQLSQPPSAANHASFSRLRLFWSRLKSRGKGVAVHDVNSIVSTIDIDTRSDTDST